MQNKRVVATIAYISYRMTCAEARTEVNLTERSPGRYTDGSGAERVRSEMNGYGVTVLSRSGAEWSGDAPAPHAETGRWSAPAQGGAAECSGAERKPGRVGGVKFEPEVVPMEPAEPGRPEADQRSTIQGSRQSPVKRV